MNAYAFFLAGGPGGGGMGSFSVPAPEGIIPLLAGIGLFIAYKIIRSILDGR